MTTTLGRRIRALRRHHGLLQQDMADKLGMSRAGYGNIELGRGSTSIRRLEEIAAILGTTAADLLRESQTPMACTESLSA